MVLIVSVALKPPLILLSGGEGGTCYNPLNHSSVKKRKIDVNVVGRVRQLYLRVHTRAVESAFKKSNKSRMPKSF